MSMKLEQAARHVVDVSELEFDNRGRPTLASLGLMHEAITALREALTEQAEQEPVAIDWEKAQEVLCDVWNRVISADDGFDAIQDLIYAAPVRTKDHCHPWQDLTYEEIGVVMRECKWMNMDYFARAVIAKFKEKNK